MATATPNYTDNVSVIAAQTLAKGATARGTIDLRSKFGAWLYPKVGFGSSAKVNPSTGIGVQIRRVLNNGTASAGIIHPASPFNATSNTGTPAQSTVSSDSALGQQSLNVASSTGFVAGDLVCIWDSGNTTFARLEWQRVSKVAAGVLTLDDNLVFTHTAIQADTVRSVADAFGPIWLPGGSLYEAVFDYGAATTGDTAVVQALAQTYDSDTIA